MTTLARAARATSDDDCDQEHAYFLLTVTRTSRLSQLVDQMVGTTHVAVKESAG